MKKWMSLFAFAIICVAVVPDTSEAGLFRRRRQATPAPCPCPCPCQPLVSPLTPYPPAVTIPPAPQSVKIKGKTYYMHASIDQGGFQDEEEDLTVAGALPDPNNSFKGKDRKIPKTTIVTDADVEDFATVAALVKDILKKNPDSVMQEKSGITTKTMTRVDAEKRNVRVNGFIYAFTKEKDNDYHVILGDAPGTNPPVFLNVEVSGLPVGGTAANLKTLTGVRNDFKDAFQVGETGPKGYQILGDATGQPTPVPVRITGSLFWDVDHKPGVVGPGDLKPKTSWEIHPVSKIEFLEE
jgi:hypothetical protein